MTSGDREKSRRKFLAKHELIGLQARVETARDPSHRGRAGRVVDETRNTLVLEGSRGEFTIPKVGSIFVFHIGEAVRVPGDRLLYRPEDRVKKAG